jgi:hypothetical protein
MNGATFQEDNSLKQTDWLDGSSYSRAAVVVVGEPDQKAEIETLHATWRVHN